MVVGIDTELASLAIDNDPVNQPDQPVFEVKEISGKGKGLIARCDILQGARILCEKPLLIAHPMPLFSLEQHLAARLKELSKESQRQFLTLHNNFPGKFPFSHTFKSNALPCGPGSSTGGVYPTICRINHSCIPNSHNNWDSKSGQETIYAIKPIKTGEEITIPYNNGGTREVRQASLKQSFDFDCGCPGCSRSPSAIRESDVRRKMIQKLDDAIGDPSRMQGRPADSLKDCQSLLEVLEEEFDGFAGVLVARLYYDAFQISIAHGDQARASAFARRSYESRVICEGEDSPETQRMKLLALKPATHSSAGAFSQKWKTAITMVPKDLGGAAFQEWLWQRVSQHSCTLSDTDEDSNSSDEEADY
ncbi:hypothetical protein BDU57DRAFT_519067 [Ampelomyces quisqualis]|uniref:SET domain-containing protein n=1 Tax=Ampelomyces quisqualis TaxID=50730 RepID=A0A6A5QI78_AMPQU|nr:hypothetical protein BDU57DRAFT_519067 [Ampelomyces quisqualis]